ncbi:MAG TPA: hypothetical protein VJ972_02515 [Anaerolineales bacterium]|nr:hypothetical protein [Anaerolineales bacterium]
MQTIWLFYGALLAVGGMLVYELYTGQAVVRGTASITRTKTPIRYWFWIVFHAAILGVLIFAWVAGVEF